MLNNSVNNISEYYNLDKIKIIENPSSGLIIISPKEDISIPLTLKSGNEILLTTRNFNISLFTKSELIEILEILETISIDNRYDQIRSDITYEISVKN